MLLEDVRSRLRIGLTTTVVEEYSLFAAGAHGAPPSERAVAAQLASRLRHLFEDLWDVDVEYSSRPVIGDRRSRSRSLQLPVTADLAIHRRGRIGRDNNLLLLVLMTQGAPQMEWAIQRLSGLMKANDFQHAALLNLNLACTRGGGKLPAVLLPTWHWTSADTQDPDVYTKEAALALCRRGHERLSLFAAGGKDDSRSQLEMFPEPDSAEILHHLEVRYGDWIRSDITSVVFVQFGDSFELQIHTSSSGGGFERIELSSYFEPADPIELNIAEFLRWDEDSIIMLCDELLEKEAIRAIAVSLGYADEEDFLGEENF